MFDAANRSGLDCTSAAIKPIVVEPFTDLSFQPSDWQPEEWSIANPLHYRSVCSQFPSRKTGRAVMCESLLENAMACLLECDPHVTAYREQPIGPTWYDRVRWRKGTARDFWVESPLGNLLVETKYTKDLGLVDKA